MVRLTRCDRLPETKKETMLFRPPTPEERRFLAAESPQLKMCSDRGVFCNCTKPAAELEVSH